MIRKFTALLLAAALLLGCLGLGAQAAGSPAVTRAVSTYYGEGAQGFHWYTAEASDSKVVVNGVTYTGSSTKFQGAYAHSAVADGLAPDTVYTYQISDYTGAFKTDPGRNMPMRFVVTGDTQGSSAADFAYSAAVQEAAWNTITAPAPDFTVTLGDHTNNCNNAEWDMYFSAFGDVHKRSAQVPIAGNHDGNFKWNWFANMFTLKAQPGSVNMTGGYYSFDYGDAHFAVLNTNDMYPMSMQQRNWLINDMSQSDAKWKIVFMHRAPYSAGNDCILPDNLLMRRTLLPIFDQLGIDLVMYGHDHHYYRSEPVKGDKVAGAASQTGTTYTDPKGTVYILPCAAATKRYALHSSILPAVNNCKAIMAQPEMPMFAGITISGGTLEYEAYTFDPATKASTGYDTLTLKKTTFSTPDPNFKPLPTDYVTTLPRHLWNLFYGVFGVLVFDYLFALLPGLLGLGK